MFVATKRSRENPSKHEYKENTNTDEVVYSTLHIKVIIELDSGARQLINDVAYTMDIIKTLCNITGRFS